MNYIVTRILIMTILIFMLVLCIIIRKKFLYNASNNKINILGIFVLCIFIWIILNIVPFENYFVKFKTIEDNVKYFFPNSEVRTKFVFDDYAYVKVVYNKTKKPVTHCFMYLKNNNGSWELSDLSNRNQGYNFKTVDFISFQTVEIPGKDSLAIEIEYSPHYVKEIYDIRDSLNSEVYTYYFENDSNIYSYIIINGKINKRDYKIYIDDKEYNPFK